MSTALDNAAGHMNIVLSYYLVYQKSIEMYDSVSRAWTGMEIYSSSWIISTESQMLFEENQKDRNKPRAV